MIKDILNIYDDIPSLCTGFTEFIKNEFWKENQHKTIALSGGETPKAIFDHWSLYHKHNLPWQQMLFFWGDERCVPPGDDMSNYGMTKKTFIQQYRYTTGKYLPHLWRK